MRKRTRYGLMAPGIGIVCFLSVTFFLRPSEAARTGSLTHWQMLLIVFVSAFGLSAGLTFWPRHPKRLGLPESVQAIARVCFGFIALGLLVLLIYLLLHEGGHALASLAFGNFDWRRSDFFGLYGSPHSGLNPAISLSGWRQAILYIAGFIVPTLAAYLFLYCRDSRWGKKLSARSLFVEALWTLTILTCLVSSLGILIPMSGLGVDTDYTVFTNSVPLALWQANALLVIVVLLNTFFLLQMIPGLLGLRRRLGDSLGRVEATR